MTIFKEYRINNDLTQEKMAKKLDISLPAYQNYEKGERVMPLPILYNFLKLRGTTEDIQLTKIIEDVMNCDKKRAVYK